MINVFMCNNNLYLDGYMWKLRCGLKFVKFYWILFILEWEKNIRIWYVLFKVWFMEKYVVKYYWILWEKNVLGLDIFYLKVWFSLNMCLKYIV